MRALNTWAWQEAVAVAVERNWDVPRGKALLKNLAERAVVEAISPRLGMCQYCNGTGKVQPNQHNPSGDCGHCDDKPSKAGLFGLDDAEWNNKWAARFAAIQSRITEWETHGLRHVRGRLKDE
jgi:hypothetical protein